MQLLDLKESCTAWSIRSKRVSSTRRRSFKTSVFDYFVLWQNVTMQTWLNSTALSKKTKVSYVFTRSIENTSLFVCLHRTCGVEGRSYSGGWFLHSFVRVCGNVLITVNVDFPDHYNSLKSQSVSLNVMCSPKYKQISLNQDFVSFCFICGCFCVFLFLLWCFVSSS